MLNIPKLIREMILNDMATEVASNNWMMKFYNFQDYFGAHFNYLHNQYHVIRDVYFGIKFRYLGLLFNNLNTAKSTTTNLHF